MSDAPRDPAPDPARLVALEERTALGRLDRGMLERLALAVEPRHLAAGDTLLPAGEAPQTLYLLRSGQLQRRTADGVEPLNLPPGAPANLVEFWLERAPREAIVAATDCELWALPGDRLAAAIADRPDIDRALSQWLADEVEELSLQLDYERERQAILRPYLVTKARRGIVGRSRYATRLRQQIRDASQHRRSVLVFGEPGLEKDNTAALIHFGSPSRRDPIAQVDCGKLQASGADLFGRSGGKPGLLAAVGTGTLVLNNVQELPDDLRESLADLLTTGRYRPVPRPGQPDEGEPRQSRARLILISERALPELDCCVETVLKVPPLRIRKGDIEDQAKYYITLICRARGIDRPALTPEALRRLQAYDFPNNIRELRNLVERALVQLEDRAELTEEIIWPSQSSKKRFRVNLLNLYPRFRNFLRSPWWPDRLNNWVVLPAFALVVAVLFLGPQTRDRNFALNLFWAWWWPLVLLGFPFVGRLWCAICPFMIYGEWVQRLSLKLAPRTLSRWPRREAERWGGWFLFGLFALILLWEELWTLEDTAYLSACLLLLITAGAIVFSLLFERRFWCRYLCPIGGMNGLFAKLSLTELRAQQGTCSAECTTYQCYKGGPEKGEGQETEGCPLYSHPAQLEDNRDCVLCMTCLKACPHRSVEFNLRPPGIELWTTHEARASEVALLALLFGAVFLHHLPQLNAIAGEPFQLADFAQHAAASAIALSLPAIALGVVYGAMRLAAAIARGLRPKPFRELAYGYLPLVLFASLAHYLPLGLGEGGRVLAVGAATFGLDGAAVPVWSAHPAVIAFLQGAALVAGAVTAGFVTQRIARQSWKLLLPQYAAIAGLAWAVGQLV